MLNIQVKEDAKPIPAVQGITPDAMESQTLAVDSPYLSFADKIFNKYKEYYVATSKGTCW